MTNKHSQYVVAWQRRNRDKYNEYMRRWRNANRQRVREIRMAYYWRREKAQRQQRAKMEVGVL